MPKHKTDNTTSERSARYRLRRKAELERLTGLYNSISKLIKDDADDSALANFCKSYMAKKGANLATATATTAAVEKALDASNKKTEKLLGDNSKLTERAAKAEGRITELEKQLKVIADNAKAEAVKSEKQK